MGKVELEIIPERKSSKKKYSPNIDKDDIIIMPLPIFESKKNSKYKISPPRPPKP